MYKIGDYIFLPFDSNQYWVGKIHKIDNHFGQIRLWCYWSSSMFKKIYLPRTLKDFENICKDKYESNCSETSCEKLNLIKN